MADRSQPGVARAIRTACVWEATARKVGNVHRTADFTGTTYLDFVLSAGEIAEPLSSADVTESAGILRRAVELVRAEFEAQTWQAFWRVVVDGRRPGDVAEELGITTNAVYLARSRVLRRLRETLADETG